MKSFPVNASVTVISSSLYDSEVSNSINEVWEFVRDCVADYNFDTKTSILSYGLNQF